MQGAVRRRGGGAAAARMLVLAAAAAAVLTAGCAATAGAADWATNTPDTVVPMVSVVVGTVEVQADGGGPWRPVVAGTMVKPGDTIRTGARSKAEVVHPTGTIRLFEHTLLRLPMEADGRTRWIRRVELFEGQSLFDVVPGRFGDFLSLVSTRARALFFFEVTTPHVVAGVKGTRFAVGEQGGRSRVGVYSGTVETSDPAGSPASAATLGAGQVATYEGGRLSGVGRLDAKDDWGRWALPGVHGARALGAPGAGADEAGKRADATQGGATGEGVTGSTAGAVNGALGAAGSAGGGLLGGTVGAVGGAVGALGGAVGSIGGAVGAVGGAVGAVGGAVSDTTGALGGAVGGLTGGLGGALGGLGGGLGGLGGGLGGGTEGGRR